MLCRTHDISQVTKDARPAWIVSEEALGWACEVSVRLSRFFHPLRNGWLSIETRVCAKCGCTECRHAYLTQSKRRAHEASTGLVGIQRHTVKIPPVLQDFRR